MDGDFCVNFVLFFGDFDGFVPTFCAGFDGNAGFWDVEMFGKKFDNCGVSLAVMGLFASSNNEFRVVPCFDGILMRAGLDKKVVNHKYIVTYVVKRVLYDVRDNNEYTIRKLADGNCWMTENLRLTFDGETTYDSTTTDLASGMTITPSATQAQVTNPTDSEIEEWAFDATGETLTPEDTDRWLSRGQNNNGIAQRESDTSAGDLTGENQLLGNLYSWYTATAGTGAYGVETNQMTSASICPKGWELPQFPNTQKDLTRLVRYTYRLIPDNGGFYDTSLQNDEFHQLPFSMPYSGHTTSTGGSIMHRGKGGVLWTAASGNQEERGDLARGKLARGLLFEDDNNRFMPHNNVTMLYGASVRCVSK